MHDLNQSAGKEIFQAFIAIVISFLINYIAAQYCFQHVNDDMLLAFLKQAVFAIPIFLFVLFFRKTMLYRPDLKLFHEGWKSAALLLFILIVSALQCVYVVRESPVHVSGIFILLFLMQMFLIGYCEETLFRGLLLNAFHRCFGLHTLTGARLSVVVSGILFGAMHLLNANHPEVSLASAAAQAGAAAFLGMFLGAVYIRTGNGLWYLVILHAINDCLGFIANGRLNGLTDAAIIELQGQRGYASFIAIAVIYGLATMFILRKKKLQPCLEHMKHAGSAS